MMSNFSYAHTDNLKMTIPFPLKVIWLHLRKLGLITSTLQLRLNVYRMDINYLILHEKTREGAESHWFTAISLL